MLAGTSEWALRLPSAMAGAAAVVVLYLTARALHLPGWPAAILLCCSPFGIWYAQEAKVYSALLLIATLSIWALVRAIHRETGAAWLTWAAIALLSLFVHRLAFLLVIAALVGRWLCLPRQSPASQSGWQRLFPWLLGLISIGFVTLMAFGMGSERAATGAYIPADPLLALWLTFVRFSTDRWPGDIAWWLLLPWIMLTLWGLVLAVADSISERPSHPAALPGRERAYGIMDLTIRARLLLSLLLVPLGLFLLQLGLTRIYEARYLMIIYPAWLLLLTYPFGRESRTTAQWSGRASRALAWTFIASITLLQGALLFQPGHGLFSGTPLKEQYREAIAELARRVHPDDLVVLHPGYLRPLYDYYMGRYTSDPPPTPLLFASFKQGQTEFSSREWHALRQQHFRGGLRSFLLIAPEHARTVDVPPMPGDEYGLVGLYYQYSREQQKWPCGIWRGNGVHLLCQASPEAYESGTVPEPATPMEATFGDVLQFLGYTLKATTPDGPGVYRAGGSLPITLYWDVKQPIPTDYATFLHLCQDCSMPPVASDDGPPLDGYLPTSTWLPGNPARDDRSIRLPRDLPPGRYTVLLGMYHPGEAGVEARLPIRGSVMMPPARLVLGSVEVLGAPQR